MSVDQEKTIVKGTGSGLVLQYMTRAETRRFELLKALTLYLVSSEAHSTGLCDVSKYRRKSTRRLGLHRHGRHSIHARIPALKVQKNRRLLFRRKARAFHRGTLGADFFGLSFYKLLGPHCAAIAAKPELLKTLNNDKLLPATSNVPERFEFGTLPYELMAGCTATIDYLANMVEGGTGSRRQRILHSMTELEKYEDELFEYLETEIAALPGISLYGHAKKRTPTRYFNLRGIEGAAVYQHLAGLKINSPAGNFYALEASRALGLEDKGAVRAGLAPYSNADDINRLIAGLRELAK